MDPQFSDAERRKIGERARTERKARGFTQAAIAADVGCTAPTIVGFEKGGPFSVRLLRDVARALGVSEEWLRTGAGKKENLSAGNVRVVRLAPTQSRRVPVVSYATAGAANDYEDLADFLDETIETDCKDPNCFALIVEGDSMEPVLRAGDRVVVAPNSEARTGDIVVARRQDTDEVFVKLAHFSDGNRRVKFSSYNPAYLPLEFSRKVFRFIYPVHSMPRVFRRSDNGHAVVKK